MRFKAAIDKYEWFITPAIGVINERSYYGYPVIAIAFAWLCFRCKLELGIKKYCYRGIFDDKENG